jgi:hypothetical protein
VHTSTHTVVVSLCEGREGKGGSEERERERQRERREVVREQREYRVRLTMI